MQCTDLFQFEMKFYLQQYRFYIFSLVRVLVKASCTPLIIFSPNDKIKNGSKKISSKDDQYQTHFGPLVSSWRKQLTSAKAIRINCNTINGAKSAQFISISIKSILSISISLSSYYKEPIKY